MEAIKANEINEIIRSQIENFDASMTVDEVGTVIKVGDGIAEIHGLEKVMAAVPPPGMKRIVIDTSNSFSPPTEEPHYGEKAGTSIMGYAILVEENVLQEVGFPTEADRDEFKQYLAVFKNFMKPINDLKEERYSVARNLSDLAYYAHMAQDGAILAMSQHFIDRVLANFTKK